MKSIKIKLRWPNIYKTYILENVLQWWCPATGIRISKLFFILFLTRFAWQSFPSVHVCCSIYICVPIIDCVSEKKEEVFFIRYIGISGHSHLNHLKHHFYTKKSNYFFQQLRCSDFSSFNISTHNKLINFIDNITVNLHFYCCLTLSL